MAKLFPTFKRFIVDNDLIADGDRVIVSVSGGIDSMVLLDLIVRARKALRITPVVAHVNHGLRGRESDGDEAFVRDASESLGLKFVSAVQKPRAGANTQDAARVLRYRFMKEKASELGAWTICLGHNRGDQAETILMHLMRGAGLSGLGGMSPSSSSDGVDIIRPLLFASRAEIRVYANERGVAFREDSTNAKRRYRRNDVRHTIIPALERINPRVEECIAEMGERLREEDSILREISHASYEEAIVNEDDDTVSFSRRHFVMMPPAIRRRILRLAFEKLSGRSADLNADQLARMDGIAASDKRKGEYRLPAPWRFEREGEILRIAKAPPRPGSSRPTSR